MADPRWAFSEKSFYLNEFRGRTIGLALPEPIGVEGRASLEPVLEELAANGTRVVVLGRDESLLAEIVGDAIAQPIEGDWLGVTWRMLRAQPRVGLLAEDEDLPRFCRRLAARLRLAKLVWLDARGALRRPDGSRVSVLDAADVAELVESGASLSEQDSALLVEVRRMLEAGLPAVNLCSVDGLADDLFTYVGSGTFFTRERYSEVRWLALDELDAAADLTVRAVEEGYLVPRGEAELERLLGNGFGVFIEGRYLAGIGALLPYADEGLGEIAGLYALTRYAGEGAGGQLVGFAVAAARERGLRAVFACTTSERVEGFFVRNGFECVDLERVPASKWSGYEPARREKLRCLWRDL